MSFDYLDVKYSYRKVRRLRLLKKRKRRQGKDFVTHEEVKMLKKMLDMMRGTHKRRKYGGGYASLGVPFILKYFYK